MIFEGHEYKNVLCVKPSAGRDMDMHRCRGLNGESIPMQKIYMADLVLSFSGKGVDVIKNRYGQTKSISFENEEEEAKFLLLL